MTKAVLERGNYDTRDYTPLADVAAGDVVVVGNRPFVAHRAIPATQLGALATFGGVYRLEKSGSAGPNIEDGDEVYWIEGTNLATNVADGNVHFGPAVGDAGPSASSVRVAHQPSGGFALDS